MTVISLRGRAKQRHLHNLLGHLSLARTVKSLSNQEQLAEICYLLSILHGDEHFSPYEEVNIEDERSGFPHYGTVITVTTHRQRAEKFLSALPVEEQLVDRCLKQLHGSDANFGPLQHQARKRKFYTALQQQPLPAVEKYSLVRSERIEDFMAYGVIYEGYEPMKMRFLWYSLALFQRGNSPYIDGQNLTPEFIALLKPKMGFSSGDVFYHLNQQRSFAVIAVERIVVGPFFTHYTKNQGTGMEKILSGDPEEHLLEIEQQVCEDTASYLTSNFDGAMSRDYKQELQLGIRYKRHFFCSTSELGLRAERTFSAVDQYVPRFYTPQERQQAEEREIAAEKKRRDEDSKPAEKKQGTGE